MKLSTIQSALTEIGMRPTKSLGQNFLHDQNLARWIVNQLDLQPSDHLVEIGPGLGALTEFALPQCASATLIEKDGRLAEFLRENLANPEKFANGEVEIVHGDAVEFDVRNLMPRGAVKLLGNLPYYISSQILFHFTAAPSPVSKLVLTIQKELAERLFASPSTKDYGALTLLIQRGWQVKYLRTLPASVFTPVPKVESAAISLTRRAPGELPECDETKFSLLVKSGFSQRRKQLRKLIAEFVKDWPTTAAEIGVSETTRAEELSLLQWIALTNFLSPNFSTANSEPAQNVHGEIFDIVDEQDRVIRQATRHETHRDGLRHRAVHIFVFNAKDELFLQKRSRKKDVHPSRWDSSAAGHVNAGENYDETAARELQEELGVSAPLKRLGEISACEKTGQEFVHLYSANHEGPFHLHPAEIETGAFFPLTTISRWLESRPQDFATGFIECFKLAEERMGEGKK